VVVELPQADIFAGINALAPFAALLVAIAAIISVIVVLFTSNRLLRPLTDLTEFAQRMSRGDWLYRASEESTDEVGMLAASLNRMGEDLSNLYRSLEDRVEERTRQVRTAAEVARVVISAPSMDDLLRSAVELIKSQFGYYHVSIFLLDERGEFAELVESTGEIGQVLKARGHRLEVGSQSVIGWVTANNQPRVVSDVSQDETHFKNELLPETRSETAVPLQVGGRVLGALDVQSTESDAFSAQDIEILQTLADQLCAAIQNASLAAISTSAAERAHLISEMTSEMSGLMDVEEVMQTAAQALHRMLGQPEIVVRLHSPDDWASFYSEQPTERVSE
ncbi:MAG: GAF domain-containing protein, partial [Anaerolineales bacterium]|nr:GAF domain-containing protein [Anaerolineales bacterium]